MTPQFKTGDLAESDDLGTVMVVEVYEGCYGREMVNAVPCRDDYDESTCAGWLKPLAYFAEELTALAD